MTLAQQLKAFTEKRADRATRQEALMKSAADEGRTLNETESQEYDSIGVELKSIDAHLTRLGEQEQRAAQTAKPVETKSLDGGPAVIVRTAEHPEAFKGQRFIQLAKAKAVAELDSRPLRDVAVFMYGKAVGELVLKVADPIVTADVPTAPGIQDFVELLKKDSAYDQLAFRPVAPYIPVAVQGSAPAGYFIGEGSAITGSKWSATTTTLSPKKAASLVPATIESVRDNSVAADRLIQTDMVYAIRTKVDEYLLDTNAGSSSRPAGLLYQVVPIVTSGSDAEDVIADVKGLVASFDPLLTGRISLLMHPRTAADIGGIRTTLGVKVFPNMSVKGGELEGFPVRVSNSVALGYVVAMVEDEIYSIGDQGVEIAISREATVNGTSAFESGLIVFRAIRPVSWQKRRSGVVQYIASAVYGPTPSTTA